MNLFQSFTSISRTRSIKVSNNKVMCHLSVKLSDKLVPHHIFYIMGEKCILIKMLTPLDLEPKDQGHIKYTKTNGLKCKQHSLNSISFQNSMCNN